jgi:hypothetical protein
MGHISQELLEEIFIPIDHLQPNFLRVLFQRVESFLVFLVRMDVGIEKISNRLFPIFSDSFKGIDRAVHTTDMEEDFHFSPCPSWSLLIQTINSDSTQVL